MTIRLSSVLPVSALSGVVVAGCGVITADTLTARDVARNGRVMAAAEVVFAPGDLARADVRDQQIMFPPYSRLPGKPVSCRSDMVVTAAGAVSHICTACTDETAETVRSVSDGYARLLHYKPGAEGRRGAVTFAFAPQWPDGTIIVPRIPAPVTGCEPQSVGA